MRGALLVASVVAFGCDEPAKVPPAPPKSVRTKPEPAKAEPSLSARAQSLIGIALAPEKTPAERTAALDELSELDEPAAIKPLVGSLQGERADEATKKAIRATLSKLHASDVLVQQLGVPNEGERLTAAVLLQTLGDRATLPALVRTLEDSSPKVRAQVATTIARFADRSTVSALAERLAKDPDVETRIALALALGVLGGEPAKKALNDAKDAEKDPFVKSTIDRALTAARP